MNEPSNNKKEVGGANAEATINDRTGLQLSIISLVMSAMALGGILVAAILMPMLFDAKIAAAVAPANEVARTAATNAKLAEDRANKIVAQLEAKGLVKMENH